MRPSVVSASKSGAVSPMVRLICAPCVAGSGEWRSGLDNTPGDLGQPGRDDRGRHSITAPATLPCAEVTPEALLAAAGGLRPSYEEVDWSATALGPVEGWSPTFRNAVDIALQTQFPVTLFWGP